MTFRDLLIGRGGLAASTGLAVVMLGASSIAFSPSSTEVLQAALAANDQKGVQSIADGMEAQDDGTRVLIAKSLLAAGQPRRAAQLLALVARRTDSNVVATLLDAALVQAGAVQARFHRQFAAARQTDAIADLRALRVSAIALADSNAERFVLERLIAKREATIADVERLAALDDLAGNREAARSRLANLFVSGEPISTAALQRLLQLSMDVAEPPVLFAIFSALNARGEPPSLATIVNDLAATGHTGAALAMAERAGSRDAPGLWRTRVELLRRANILPAARTMLDQATNRPGTASPSDIIETAYALDMPLAIVRAAESGAIPRPNPALTLDLVRRAEQAKRPDLVAKLDRVGELGWRAADPWLGIRIAQKAGDTTAALRCADLLPSADADAAREAILTQANDRKGLHALLLARAKRDPRARWPSAERLLSLGWRDDALDLLRADADGAAIDSPVVQRLLSLWGPRPKGTGLAWLKARAAAAAPEEQRLRWLTTYAGRDKPTAALSTLEADQLAERTPVLLLRIALANASRKVSSADAALRLLLDGRALSKDDLAQATAQIPSRADETMRLELTRRRIAANVALPHDRLDLAWAAWQAGQVDQARSLTADQLAGNPKDSEALRLMADIVARSGSEKQVRPWIEQALAAMPAADSADRAQLLARVGRVNEALMMVGRLRSVDLGDRALIATQARLLIAAGRPGQAQALFRQ